MEQNEQYRETTKKIFSDDFCLWLRITLSTLTPEEKQRYLDVSSSIYDVTKGKKMSDCILALSVFLPATIVAGGLNIDDILHVVTEHNKNMGVEKYIQ